MRIVDLPPSPFIEATRRAVCTWCLGTVVPGELVLLLSPQGVVHEECADLGGFLSKGEAGCRHSNLRTTYVSIDGSELALCPYCDQGFARGGKNQKWIAQ